MWDISFRIVRYIIQKCEIYNSVLWDYNSVLWDYNSEMWDI